MAQITISIPNNHVQRVQDAFAYALGLGSPSSQVTLTTVQEYIIADLKQFVKNAEKRKAEELIVVGSPEIVDFS